MTPENTMPPPSVAPVKRRRIALLDSPYLLSDKLQQHAVPLSLLYLAAALEKAGFEPRIFTMDQTLNHKGAYFWTYNLPTLLESLADFDPQLVGIACPYSARWCFVRRLTQILRRRFAVPIVIGGIHPTSFPDYCLTTSEADFAILGEGDETTVQLASCLLEGRSPTAIDGLAYKMPDGVVVNPKTHYIADLDDLPFPAYHLIDMDAQRRQSAGDQYFQLKGMYFSILTSRSCPNQCAFCNMFMSHGKRWRSRSPENVLAEIRHLVERYGVRQFAVVDDNFTFNRERAIQILRGIIDSGLDIRVSYANGLSLKTLDDELISLIKKAGACELYISIESGSAYVRNEIYGKRIPEEKIHEVYAACQREKLPVSVNFMIGAPGESDGTISASIAMMRKVRAPAYFNFTTPFKGTKLYDDYLRQGLINEKDFQEGYAIDLRVPIPGLHDGPRLMAWRRKLRLYNLLYSWRQILATPGLLSWNSAVRWFQTILQRRGLTPAHYLEVMDRYLPLEDGKSAFRQTPRSENRRKYPSPTG